MIRATSILLMALSLGAQSPAVPTPPAKPTTSAEEQAIQRFRAHARPRAVAPAAPLSAEDRNTIRRFREAKPSVVFVSAFILNPDPTGPPRLPAGTGTGFVWDE